MCQNRFVGVQPGRLAWIGMIRFLPSTDARILIQAVEEGSEPHKTGLKPGDRIISLAQETGEFVISSVDADDWYFWTNDTSITVLRDSMQLQFNLDPSKNRSLEGITSQFTYDSKQQCIWLKINTEHRIRDS